MTKKNQYDWKELKSYLEAFIQARVDQDMSDPDFYNDPEINWTADDARLNAIENLQESIKIIFGNEIYRNEIENNVMKD